MQVLRHFIPSALEGLPLAQLALQDAGPFYFSASTVLSAGMVEMLRTDAELNGLARASWRTQPRHNICQHFAGGDD